jgi:peroxiredoxin family protein
MVQVPEPRSMDDIDALIRDRVDALATARVEELLAIKEAERAAKPKKLAIIATKGTLDWAYPPLILASAAAAVGMDVGIFFTFYGLNIIHKDYEKKLKVDAVGNPAMPMPVPMPDLVTAMPGMVSVASRMMKKRFADHKVATISEMLDTCREMDVRFIACQMTVDVFGYEQSDFIEGVEFGGAAAFMADARKSNMTLFI